VFDKYARIVYIVPPEGGFRIEKRETKTRLLRLPPSICMIAELLYTSKCMQKVMLSLLNWFQDNLHTQQMPLKNLYQQMRTWTDFRFPFVLLHSFIREQFLQIIDAKIRFLCFVFLYCLQNLFIRINIGKNRYL